MRLTPEFPRKSPVVFAQGSWQQPEITARMPTSQDQAPGAEPQRGEGMGVSQLRPPAIVCGENVRILSAARLAQALHF